MQGMTSMSWQVSVPSVWIHCGPWCREIRGRLVGEAFWESIALVAMRLAGVAPRVEKEGVRSNCEDNFPKTTEPQLSKLNV